MSHPTGQLDKVVHQQARLGILSVLVEAKRADFGYLRDTLDLSDGNLSRNIQVLEETGYVRVEKTFEKRRPRTWLSITTSGKAAFKREVKVLKEIIEGSYRPDA